MSPSLESENLEEPEFKWGKKRGIGGKRKDVQFYESFMYDGVDYALYDCVYMYKEGESAPYIGKLVKIWENADKSKRIKVHWFFRPSEIIYYLKSEKVLENELFLASGDGTGLANLNPLEAIAGKCHVVCISTDTRNPQPSAEELEMADYVFHRVFDVKSCTISDQMNDIVGGLEVKFVFNRRQSVSTVGVSVLVSSSKDQDINVISCKETLKCAGKSSPHYPPQQLDNVKLDENGDRMLTREDKNAKLVKVKEDSSLRKCSSGVEERTKSTIKSGNLDDRASKRAKADGAVLSLKTKDTNGVVKNSVGSGKDVKRAEEAKEKPEPGLAEDAVGLDKDVKLTKNSNSLQGKPSKTNAFPSAENPESAHTKDSVSTGNRKKLGEKSSDFGEKSSTKAVSPNETATPEKTSISLDETSKSGPSKDFEGSGQASKLVKSSSASTKRPLKTSADLSKEKSNHGHDACLENNDSTLEGGPPKKGKTVDSVKMANDNKNNTIKKLEEEISAGETKPSPTHLTSYGNKAKSRLGKGPLKEHHDEKVGKFSNDKFTNPLTTFEGDEGKSGGQIFEVTQRPNVEKSKWMKLPWDDRMKTAHDQGRLVLLQNLDPEYTSGEVEDIVWHAFREDCTARMVQHTATSNPHAGQAFVIFKTREAVEKVVKKLEEGCLMLPNRRPLVVCTGVFPKSSEKQTFVGHLNIDRARRQIQRELKDAVSTSHYSQNNTIEYEMAMSWCLLQAKSDKWWAKLYEQQRKEVKKLADGLKLK